VHKLLDIVWHNAVESLVEHRAWLAEDRRGRSTCPDDNWISVRETHIQACPSMPPSKVPHSPSNTWANAWFIGFPRVHKTRQWQHNECSGVSSIYARIYIPYKCTVLYNHIQTGRPPVSISSELKLTTNSWLAQYLSNLLLKELTISLYHIIRQTVPRPKQHLELFNLFAGLTVAWWQTNGYIDHATLSVTIGRIYYTQNCHKAWMHRNALKCATKPHENFGVLYLWSVPGEKEL